MILTRLGGMSLLQNWLGQENSPEFENAEEPSVFHHGGAGIKYSRDPLPNPRNFYKVHSYLATLYHTTFQISHRNVYFAIVSFNIKHKYYLWMVLKVCPLLQCIGKTQS